MSSSVSNFIKTHRCLCMMTLGIAIVAYLGYRAVVVIKDKCCGTTTKTKAVAKNVFDQSATPPVPQKDPFANLTSIQHVAKKVLDHVYDEFTGATPAKPFAFRIFVKNKSKLEEAPLYLEYTEDGVKTEKPLTEVIDAVAWQALDKKWEKFELAKLTAYKSKAKILTQPSTTHEHPFLAAYLAQYFQYTNNFLRFGKIYEINHHVTQITQTSNLGINEAIHKIAKELFFMCAAAAGSLQSLPKTTSPQYVYRRMWDKKTLEKIYKLDQFVVEKAFISTSKDKNRLNGGFVQVIIKRLNHSCGKDVQKYQEVASIAKDEQECLFPPFTKFKVTKLKSDDGALFVHMDEVAS